MQSDCELLCTFVDHRDEGAFETLVRRHNPMVFNVCLRILHDAHDAEDASQAVFLTLVHKASALRGRNTIAGWLHNVAAHIALRARESRARTTRLERDAANQTMASTGDADSVLWENIRADIDSEVERLPEKYREALLLHHFQGHTQEQTAAILRCNSSTISMRLTRGRELLKEQLARRGTVLTGVVIGALLSRNALAAVNDAAGIAATVKAGVLAQAGQSVPTDLVSSRVNEWASGALRTMNLARIKAAAGAFAALAMLSLCGFIVYRTAAADVHPVYSPTQVGTKRDAKSQPAVPARQELPDGAVLRLGELRFRMTESVIALAVSPDGNTIAAGSWARDGRLWNVKTQKYIALKGHTDCVECVAFSADSKLVASGSRDHDVRVWEASSGRSIRRLSGHTDTVTALAFLPDGTLVSASDDESIRYWNVENGTELKTLTNQGEAVTALALSPDGNALLSCGRGQIKRRDAVTGDVEWQCAAGIANVNHVTTPAFTLAIAPDGKTFACGGADRSVVLRDFTNGNQIKVLFEGKKQVLALAFSKEGHYLAASSYDGIIRIFDTTSGLQQWQYKSGEEYVRALYFTPDGNTLAWGDGNTLRLSQLNLRGKDAAPKGHTGFVNAVAVSADGKIAFTASHDKTIRVWNLATGEETNILRGHESYVTSLALSPDGKSLASAGWEDEARIWDLKHGTVAARLTGSCHPVAFSVDGKTLYTGSASNTDGTSMLAWDVDSKLVKNAFKSGAGTTLSNFILSPDGKLIISGQRESISSTVIINNGTATSVVTNESLPEKKSPVYVWDANTCECLFKLYGHTFTVWHFLMSNDQKRLLSSGHEGITRMWDLPARRSVYQFKGVGKLAYLPGDEFFVIDNEGTLEVRKAATGELHGVWPGHTTLISDIAVTADGKFLVTGSWDTTSLVWSVEELRKPHRLRPDSQDN